MVDLKSSEVLSLTEEKQVLVILGDGRLEKRIVRELAPKFDGTGCTLVFTQLPPPFRVKRGVDALEALTRLLHLGYRVDKVLFVVDREHVSSDLKGLVERLKEWGFDVREVRQIGANAYFIDGLHGSSPFNLYIAVAGRERSIDEEVQELAKTLGLHKSSRKVLKMIGEVGRGDLEKCFVGLTSALRFIEHECESPRGSGPLSKPC